MEDPVPPDTSPAREPEVVPAAPAGGIIHEVVPAEVSPIEVVPAEGAEYADIESSEDTTGERSFLVAAGEAVQAAEQVSATRETMSAILAAVILHLIVVVLFGVLTLSSPPPAPPQISVSSIANTTETEIESQMIARMQPKNASEAASSTMPSLVAGTAFTDFSVPTTIDSSGTNLSMVAMSNSDAGFGMSMSGMGDISNMAAIPAGMRSRCSMSERMKRLRESGGEDRAERAVREGLVFLSTKQDSETGAFGEEYTAAMTGLSLLAFLGHCETPESAKFGEAVVKAALFLMDRGLKHEGRITNGKRGHHEAYEHAIATYALAELYTMTKASGKEIPRLESVIRKAAGVIVDAQTRDGGWPYGFTGKGKEDMSVSGWQIQALKAAHNTGRNFPGVAKSLDLATQKYLPSIQDSEGAFKYNPDHAKGKPTLTGAALLAMQIWKGTDTPTYTKGMRYLSERYKNPSPGADYYAPYYNTQAFFLHEGPQWENYNKQFQPKLLDAQNEDGSWLQQGGARKDHQILNTAWAILMLEVYYRYLPTTDKVTGLEAR